jgi:GTPase SAR1 family protein
MGCVQSADSPPSKRNKRINNVSDINEKKNQEIEEFFKEEEKEDKTMYKLLLLGAGESGKSTLFKQARSLYGQGFSENDLIEYCSTISENILESMQILIAHAKEDDLLSAAEADHKLEESIDRIRNLDAHDFNHISESLGVDIQRVWSHPVIQETFDRRSSFQILDSIKYYCQHISRIAREDYIPSFQDVLMSRRTTLGVTEKIFKFKNRYLKFVDVGGQRSQRNKWMKQFSGCNAVIFVAAISEYDQVLRENESTNRLSESNQLFNVISKSPDLQGCAFILFLNKTDLFYDKLVNKKIPLNICYPDYQFGFDCEKASAFIKSQFEKGCDRDQLYIHFTCATDPDNMKKVMTTLADVTIQNILTDNGMLG